MFPALASSIALRSRALPSGSPPPDRAATVISLMNFVNSLPRLASSAPFLCLILCHFECPDILKRSFGGKRWIVRQRNISQESYEKVLVQLARSVEPKDCRRENRSLIRTESGSDRPNTQET